MRQRPYQLFWNTIIITTFALITPITSQARVQGQWDTTTLSRIDVTAINAPHLTPEHYVDIADGTYHFWSNAQFTAGEIKGRWQESNNKYSVTVNKSWLEQQFINRLESNPGVFVNEVTLLQSSFSGNVLDNGLWGNENYVYRVDTTKNNRREIVKVAMTVRVAGFAVQAFKANQREQPGNPMLSSLDLAVNAVMRHWHEVETHSNTYQE
ncbi:hypothetical protein [Methylocucumis oryzae]|uniref:Uncharacterized protein n=1 Tax=Methylocucumis oryzae TaxID=1632867 RepID=A0A0F3IKI6_9GAMM|nr:hypothetical protein [Methylocucumis oryzae]KJV07226.1 hypothetical protein VZ94_06090 [Methylocucumis oryzae]